MVEAALVIPVLVCFLGVGTMMFRGYQTKLEQNQAIRSAALDFAAHDCERQGSGLGASGKNQVTRRDTTVGAKPQAGGDQQAQDLESAMEKRSPAVNGRSGFAQAEYGTQTVGNPFVTKANGGQGLKLKVNGARSETLCNDAPMDGDLAHMAETIGGEVSKNTGGRENKAESHGQDTFKY